MMGAQHTNIDSFIIHSLIMIGMTQAGDIIFKQSKQQTNKGEWSLLSSHGWLNYSFINHYNELLLSYIIYLILRQLSLYPTILYCIYTLITRDYSHYYQTLASNRFSQLYATIDWGWVGQSIEVQTSDHLPRII